MSEDKVDAKGKKAARTIDAKAGLPVKAAAVIAKPAAPVAKAASTPASAILAKPAAIAKPAPVAKAAPVVAKPAPAVAKAVPVTAAPKPIVAKAAPAVKDVVADAEKAFARAVETVPTPKKITQTIEAVVSPADLRATVSDAINAVQAVPATTKEGIKKMATVTNETVGLASEKLQTMFGDFGNRFKAGFEKSTKLSEDMVELAKGNVEAVVASARVAAKGSEALGQEAAEYGKKNFETMVSAFKSFASVKSPTELFQLQSDFAKAQFDAAVAEASRVSESVLKLAGEVAQPLSTRYAVAAEKIKSATI